MRAAWKEVADENRNLNRQQHTLNEEAGRLKDRCETLYRTEREFHLLPQLACMSGLDLPRHNADCT